MQVQSIAHWLRKKSRVEAALDITVGSFLVFCCIAVLGLTWGFGYLIGLLCQLVAAAFSETIWRFELSQTTVLNWIFASAFLLMVFVAYFRKERESFAEFADSEYVAGRDSFFPWAVKMSVYTAGDVLGKILSDVMLIGPRLSFFTVSLFRRAVRLCHLDYWRCAQILEALVRRGKRMSFAEMEQVVPDANRFHVFDQLRDIEGVVFLLGEPAGVSLVQELRSEIRRLPVLPAVEQIPPPPLPPRPRPEFRPPSEPPRIELPTELSECFILLGLKTNASLEQVREAYRRKIKECHPDRFMRMGRDWQKLAENRSKQINRAYEMISGKGF